MRQAFRTQTLIRNALKTHGGALRQSEIRDLIGLAGENGYGLVNNAIRDLVKRGEIERTGYGRYRWTGKTPDSMYFKSQNQIWRFMWIRSKKNEPFTVRTVHEMTGVALYTVKKYATFLSRSGYLEMAGRKRAFKTNAPLYLIPREKMNESFPIMRRQRPTEDIEKLLAEVRQTAAGLFQTADTRLETIQEFLKTVRSMVGILERCEKIAASHRKGQGPGGN